MSLFQRYRHWLHTQWPAGHVEQLPELDEHGQTNLPGVYVIGDLQGIPLLKFALDSGAKAVKHISASLKSHPPLPVAGEGGGEGGRTLKKPSPSPSPEKGEGVVYDVLIVGGGVAGMSAAKEAQARGLSFKVLEASEPFSTIINFPKAKPIYTYPKEMKPEGRLQVSADLKETLIEELHSQTQEIPTLSAFAERIERDGDAYQVLCPNHSPVRARFVLVAIGRSGNFRMLKVPGEKLPKVYNRLHDPKDFAGQDVLVVGGGDTSMETVIALVYSGARVTLSYRGKDLSKPKPENVEQVHQLAINPMADVAVEDPKSERITTAVNDYMIVGDRQPGHLRMMLGTTVQEIQPDKVILKDDQGDIHTLKNDAVFTMIGREAPLDFFERSDIRFTGEWTWGRLAACAGFVLFSLFLYNWKSGGMLSNLFYQHRWFPTNLATTHPETLLGIIALSASSPSFWYTLAYSTLVVIFGFRRIRRRKTPYVTAQTLTLMAIQVVPLFLLPEIILPWLGTHHLIPAKVADALFPIVTYGHGREYWRAYGFILAWPLMVYNVFTSKPLFWWLVISFVQTFVLIPGMIYFWGKGAYCGWICSCGALAETLGDTQRTKMPHGAKWNRLNMAGQGILAIAFLMLIARIIGWVFPGTHIDQWFDRIALHNYKWLVDVGLAGVVGYGLYFWYSGRVWCRFFCPLAALMHIYSRFSRFRILADKKKCISCNVCTSVCHQGIDVMNFANKGLPMHDPQCVRCSACVQQCPTGVLSFGQVDKDGHVLKTDSLAASPVQLTERS